LICCMSAEKRAAHAGFSTKHFAGLDFTSAAVENLAAKHR